MRSIKCVVVGDGAVGKTSLLISYTTNTFPRDYIPTVFDNYSTTVLLPNPTNDGGIEKDPQLFKLNLWDTAGQEEYDRLRPLSYPQTDIFLVCFSISEPSSLQNVVDKWYPEIVQNSSTESSEFYRKLGKYPIFLVGTKADLRDSVEERERLKELNADFVSKEEIDKVVNQCGFIGYVECSAATQSGVTEVFERSVAQIVYEPERANAAAAAAAATATERQQQEQEQEQEQGREQKVTSQNKHPDKSHKQKKSAQAISNAVNQHSSTGKIDNTNNNSRKDDDNNRNSSAKYLRKMKKRSKCVIL